MSHIHINKQVKFPLSDNKIKKIAQLTATKIGLTGEIEINIVGKAIITKLNKQYRKINRPTDVLSFAWKEDKIVRSNFIGQIYICYPQIIRQARENKVSVNNEFVRILAHGILHLAGYDHDTKKKEKRMFGMQERIAGVIASEERAKQSF